MENSFLTRIYLISISLTYVNMLILSGYFTVYIDSINSDISA